MRNKYLKIFFIVLIMGVFSSCNNSDKNDGIDFLVNKGTKAQAFAGDWYVILSGSDGTAYSSHYAIHTFNTSENLRNLFWIQDKKFKYQVTAQGNGDDLTFALKDGKTIIGTDNITSLSGKILKNLGKSKTGNVTDSIHIELEFASEPGVKYFVSGHKRTRWQEDDF